MLFSKEIVDRYVNEFPFFCPYCSAEAVVAGDFQVEFNYAWQDVRCTKCNKEWLDEFKLINIIEK